MVEWERSYELQISLTFGRFQSGYLQRHQIRTIEELQLGRMVPEGGMITCVDKKTRQISRTYRQENRNEVEKTHLCTFIAHKRGEYG